ncbi:MAG: hypothetical protein GC180_12810 [Bacteroidetes bacterium]|nr:hypothetical protein [Bacteroidota bacterium]
MAFGLISCFKEPDTKTITTPIGSQTLLVLNEGNFQWGNASVTRYMMHDQSYDDQDLFSQANGRPLGDVLQSAMLIDGQIWLVVNNSGRIEVVDKSSFKLVHSLTDFNSPRYLCPIDSGLLLVSDLYDDSISVLHQSDGSLQQKIALKGWTEQMLRLGDDVWVSNPNSYKIYQLDEDSLYLKDSIDIGFGSFALSSDSQNRIWIATKGDKTLGIPAQIHCLDPNTKSMIHSLNIGTEPIIDFYLKGDFVYYIQNNKLYRFPTDSPTAPGDLLYDKGGNLYAVELHDNRIFICDAVDFVQRGKVIVLDTSGAETHSFLAGRIPNGFLFIP